MDREPALTRPFRDKLPEDFPIPGVNPYVASHRELPGVVPASEAPAWKGRWAERFGEARPLHLEVGSGNGFYLSGMAARHPGRSWLGLELRFKRVVLAARKLEAAGLGNARVARYDAWFVDDLFAPGELAGLHVNHPDPWARRSQARKRLVGPAFFERVTPLLAPGAEVRLKTDFAPHVDALLAAVALLPYTMLGVSEDIERLGAPWPDEVRTNYQRKATLAGRPVLAAWLRRR